LWSLARTWSDEFGEKGKRVMLVMLVERQPVVWIGLKGKEN